MPELDIADHLRSVLFRNFPHGKPRVDRSRQAIDLDLPNGTMISIDYATAAIGIAKGASLATIDSMVLDLVEGELIPDEARLEYRTWAAIEPLLLIQLADRERIAAGRDAVSRSGLGQEHAPLWEPHAVERLAMRVLLYDHPLSRHVTPRHAELWGVSIDLVLATARLNTYRQLKGHRMVSSTLETPFGLYASLLYRKPQALACTALCYPSLYPPVPEGARLYAIVPERETCQFFVVPSLSDELDAGMTMAAKLIFDLVRQKPERREILLDTILEYRDGGWIEHLL